MEAYNIGPAGGTVPYRAPQGVRDVICGPSDIPSLSYLRVIQGRGIRFRHHARKRRYSNGIDRHFSFLE